MQSITKQLLVVFVFLAGFWGVPDSYLHPVSLGRGSGSYPRKHTRPQRSFLHNQLAQLRQHKHTATMCMVSEDCPQNRYCCQVIKGVFNICCGDPLRSGENAKGGALQPIPIERAPEPYDF